MGAAEYGAVVAIEPAPPAAPIMDCAVVVIMDEDDDASEVRSDMDEKGPDSCEEVSEGSVLVAMVEKGPWTRCTMT